MKVVIQRLILKHRIRTTVFRKCGSSLFTQGRRYRKSALPPDVPLKASDGAVLAESRARGLILRCPGGCPKRDDHLLQVQVRSLRQRLMESVACKYRCRPIRVFEQNCN